MRSKRARKVILIAGASTGMGRCCAQVLHARGHRVYAASRTIATREPRPAYEVLALDVTDGASVKSCVERVLAQEGRIDVLINSAGFGIAGAIEDTTIDEARAQLETNFFGTAALCREVLPGMRGRGAGLVVNISSIGARIPMPFQAFYAASKAALTAYSRALRLEVAALGVQVVVVEPGDYHTDFTSSRRLAAASAQGPYTQTFTRVLEQAQNEERNASGPASVAALVNRLVDSASPRASYLVGPIFQRFAVWLEKWLPQQVLDWALSTYFRLR